MHLVRKFSAPFGVKAFAVLGLAVVALAGPMAAHDLLGPDSLGMVGNVCACGGGGSGDGGGSSDGGGGDGVGDSDPGTPPVGFQPGGSVSFQWTGDTSSGPLSREIQALLKRVKEVEGQLREFHLEEQTRFERNARRHERNANLLTIAKYGLHVIGISTTLMPYSKPAQFAKLPLWFRAMYDAQSIYGKVTLPLSIVEYYGAAQEAVQAVKNLHAASKAPAR